MSLLPLLMSFTKAVPLLLLFRDVLLPLMFVVFLSMLVCRCVSNEDDGIDDDDADVPRRRQRRR